MIYEKPYLTLDQQINQLESRGMLIPDREKAEEYLRRIGYYRLSAYWYPFRETQIEADGKIQKLDEFKPGTSFKNITDIYAFDKTLRLIALDAIERIEISVRTEIALTIGLHDSFAHRIPNLLDGNFIKTPPHKKQSKYSDWLGRLDNKERYSKEEFAEHFRNKYTKSKMPIWIAVELLDFGPLSHFLSGMKYRDLQVLVGSYGNLRPHLTKNWIRTLCGVRNVCAHHARFWNKPLVDQPAIPRKNEIPNLSHLTAGSNSRIYSALAIMQYFLRIVNPRTKWRERLVEHVNTFPQSQHLNLASAGFPDDWQSLDLWQ